MMRLQTLVSIAICIGAVSAWAQKDAQPSTLACPTAASMDHRHLQGLWRAEFEGPAQGRLPGALLRLGPHPELAESVRGTVQRGSATAQVVGDVDDGALTLEESDNGTNISATWTGQVVDGSCGKEIRGTWSSAPAPERPVPFVLRKQGGGWQ